MKLLKHRYLLPLIITLLLLALFVQPTRTHDALPPSLLDTDLDGMPDAWEIQHGLNPTTLDADGTQLSWPLLGMGGYTNLEVYQQWVAE